MFSPRSPKVLELTKRLEAFMRQEVLPREALWLQQTHSGVRHPEFVEQLKAKARDQGLWNLFLPGLASDEPGTRLTNFEYAPLAEIMGRVSWASEVFNCSAPDTGNIELLHLFASAYQREQWLRPLLDGEIRSCFAMTEPDVASSDPSNLRTVIAEDGEDYVITGRKWFVTGALHPHCRVVVVVGVHTFKDLDKQRYSILLVPSNSPGLRIVRNIPVLNHEAPEGHCEIQFDNVRVSKTTSLLGAHGHGLKMAQARLGPGRIHHCMRTIGQCELALQLMCERAVERNAFGKRLADFANVQDWIAESRIEIDQVRLLTLGAADRIDRLGSHAARTEVAAIKVAATRLLTRVVDRAIQVFGAKGLTPDTPLAALYVWARALRFVDGPEEVHLRTVARQELAKIDLRSSIA